MQEESRTANPATRMWHRLKQVRWSSWGRFSGLALLVVGVLAWVPVDWPRVAARLWNLLASWGVFTLPALVALGGAGTLAASTVPTWSSRARRRQHTEQRPPVRPLRWWWVVLIALVIAAVAGWALWWLMGLAEQSLPKDEPQARIDAVRTALTLGAGLVGVVALVLTSRKQWLAEHTQRHTESTTAEQQAIELYTAAAEQLASDKAPVRLAGLYALSRLGQHNPTYRQTIVDLWCAYLRMPDPSAIASAEESVTGVRQEGEAQPLLLDLAPALAEAAGLSLDGVEQQRQEHQVRRTAQRLLSQHLRPEFDTNGRPTNRDFWSGDEGTGLDLDLAGATLNNWNLGRCWVGHADFTDAHFHGTARFEEVQFHASVEFNGAHFHDHTWFQRARFHMSAWFGETQFHRSVDFLEAQYHGLAWFSEAQFHNRATFQKAQFHSGAEFDEAKFHGGTGFGGAWARRDLEIPFESTWPAGWTVREANPGDDRGGRWDKFIREEGTAAAGRAGSTPSTSPEGTVYE